MPQKRSQYSRAALVTIVEQWDMIRLFIVGQTWCNFVTIVPQDFDNIILLLSIIADKRKNEKFTMWLKISTYKNLKGYLNSKNMNVSL